MAEVERLPEPAPTVRSTKPPVIKSPGNPPPLPANQKLPGESVSKPAGTHKIPEDEIINLDEVAPLPKAKPPTPLPVQGQRTKPPLPPAAKKPAAQAPKAIPAPRRSKRSPHDTGEDEFWKFAGE